MKIGGTRVKDFVYGVSLQVNMLLGIDFLQKMGCNVTAGEVPIRGGRGDAIYVQSEHTLCSGYFLTPCGCALIFSRGW